MDSNIVSASALLQGLILANIQAGMICPVCQEPCGHLYRDEDTPEGACLGCKIDHDCQARHEDEWANSEDGCCSCGCD
jgi:hypothetical protein